MGKRVTGGWLLLSLLVSGLVSPTLFAADDIVVTRPDGNPGSHLYLGVAAGYADYRETGDGDAGFSLSGGYRIDELLAVELGWMDLGDASKGDSKAEATALTAAVVGSLPLRTDLTAFARLGLAGWRYRLTEGGVRRDDSDTDLWFGIGLDYDVGAHSSVRFAGDFLFMSPELGGDRRDERILFFSVGFLYKP